jgi:hypothetical protein
MKMRIVAVLITLFGAGFCLVRSYSVEPRTAQLSGWTHGEDGYVAQTVTCSFDSLSYIELFAGAKGAGGAYTATVYDGTSPVMSSSGDRVPEHGWVKFENWNTRVAFTKGKQLTIKFTRAGNDSIEFYYQDGDPYKYGFMVTNQPHAGQDLAMRCLGHPRLGEQATAAA